MMINELFNQNFGFRLNSDKSDLFYRLLFIIIVTCYVPISLIKKARLCQFFVFEIYGNLEVFNLQLTLTQYELSEQPVIKTNLMNENNKVRPRFTKEVKTDVINAIVNGELWLEEAMAKYNVQDRRTVIIWLRKYLRKK